MNPPTHIIFRVRKFDYNRYSVHHDLARGIISAGNIVTEVLEPPENSLEIGPMNEPQLAIHTINVMSFINLGKKNAPNPHIIDISSPEVEKIDITRSIPDEDRQEPYNEYVVAKDPPLILRTKSLLLKVVVCPNLYNEMGDPVLIIKQSHAHSVHKSMAPEANIS